MGLASKLGTNTAPTGAPGAGAPAGQYGGGPSAPPGYPQVNPQQGVQRPGQYGGVAPSAPPMGGQSQYGGPGTTQTSNQPTSSPYGAPPQGQTGQSQPGQYGQPPQGQPGQSQPGQYGQPPSGQYGQSQPGQYGQPPSGQYGQSQPGQYGQAPQTNQYGRPAGQQQGSQYPGMPGQGQQAQYGQQPGSMPGQPGGMPGQQQSQYNQQGQQGQYPNMGGMPGQSNQTGMQGSQGGSSTFTFPIVLQKLQKLAQENGLHHFYPPQKLEQVARFVASRDVEGLGQRWRLPREVTLDLVGLALYDICIYVDDSGSMAFEEGGERIDDMKAVLGRTADAATLFDTDGIVVRFMNSPVEGNGIHSEAEATQLIQQIRFSGTTPLGSSLDRKVLQPMVLAQARSGSMQKPVLVICVTDGEPTGEPKDTVRQVIMNTKNHLANSPYGAGAVAFQFAQVGKDAAATRFLSSLDTDPIVGRMIDCTSYYEQEQEEYARKGIQLDPSLSLVKLMVGGIDRSYDEGDEG